MMLGASVFLSRLHNGMKIENLQCDPEKIKLVGCLKVRKKSENTVWVKNGTNAH